MVSEKRPRGTRVRKKPQRGKKTFLFLCFLFFCSRAPCRLSVSFCHCNSPSQNNVYNPFSDDSKAMIRELGDVELIELCEYQKYNVLAVFFVGIKELCTALADDA